MSETKKRHYTHPRLSPEDEWKIIDTYVHTDQSIGALAKDMGLQGTYPYRVLDKNGISWRRGDQLTFDQWANEHAWRMPDSFHVEAVPEALQRIAREVGAAHAIPEITLLDESNTFGVWVISVVEKFEVAADSIDSALAQGKQLRPGARITSIRVRE